MSTNLNDTPTLTMPSVPAYDSLYTTWQHDSHAIKSSSYRRRFVPSHSSPLSSIPLLLFPSPKNQLWDQGGTISSENCGWMLTYEDIRYKFTLLTLQLDKSWWRLPPWWTQVLKIGGARTPGLRRNRCLCIEPDRKVSRAVLQYANHRVNHRQDARTGSQA